MLISPLVCVVHSLSDVQQSWKNEDISAKLCKFGS